MHISYRHDVAVHNVVASHVGLGDAHHRSLAQPVVANAGSGNKRMELCFTSDTPYLWCEQIISRLRETGVGW